MKWTLLRNFKRFFFISLGFNLALWAHEESGQPSFSSAATHEVVSLGAPTTGSLVEGRVGSTHKGCRHRFYCHSSGPVTGFLGPQTTAKLVSLKDQPGIFPAPLMGAASISFHFHCQDHHMSVIPLVVRPDGTVFQGFPMTALNSPQTLVISSPAQTGIYTLFILPQQKDEVETHVTVEASISTQPQNDQTFNLKPFHSKNKDAELISAEFIYVP